MEAVREPGAFSAFEWLVSWRYLRPRRKEGFISVIAGFSFLGIMLGVAALIIVMAVMNGFRAELLGKILGYSGHVVAVGVDGEIHDFDAMATRLRAIDGVVTAIPYVEGQVMVSSPQTAGGALVRGMREADLQSLPSVRGTLRAGTLDGFDEGEGIAVGSRLAIKLGVAVGDKITLISPRGPETPFGVAPQVRAYPIAAVFQVGMSEIDAAVVFMPMAEAQDYFQVEDAVTAIEILVADPDSVERYVPAIVEAASGPVRVSTWQETNRVYFNALQVERNVMFLILTLIVLVAALNIVSGMIMLVKDKGSDIAILRTMGATRGSIMRIFLLAGAAIGVVGTFAGFTLGIVFCANIESIRRFLSWLTNTELFSPELYFLSQLPAKVEPREVVTVVVMALVLSLSATIYPSWRAARLDPVEALRYE